MVAGEQRDCHTPETLTAEGATMDPGHTWFWGDEPELLETAIQETPWPVTQRREKPVLAAARHLEYSSAPIPTVVGWKQKQLKESEKRAALFMDGKS